jgi:ABC-type multidrug transport system ATPase subunit
METADSFKTLYATQYGDVVKKSGATELVWKDVTVKSKTGTVLLDGVSGSVCGRLLGVLGPSGSGKTTLLNQLSLRTQGVEMIGGEQLMNGVPYSKQDVQSLTSYVLQDDLLFSNLTVEECLEFAADMLMHPRATKLDKNRRVKKLLSLLDLSECKDVIIGSPLEKGISGGQRKRCSVGMALINRPSVVFLDEPTTGLDSETSFGLVHSLKGLAVKEKVTVVATIHQVESCCCCCCCCFLLFWVHTRSKPSSAIVSLFDDLLILDHGRVMYHGPQNLASAHFARAGYPCPPRMNTVEWFLEVVSSDDGREKLLSLPDRGLCSVVGGKSGAEQKVDVEEDQDAIDMDDFSRQLPEPTKRINVFRQFQVLLLRSLKLSFRDRLLVFIQLFQTTLMALLIGAAYYQLPNIQSNIATRRASLFFCVVNQGVFGKTEQKRKKRKEQTKFFVTFFSFFFEQVR